MAAPDAGLARVRAAAAAADWWRKSRRVVGSDTAGCGEGATPRGPGRPLYRPGRSRPPGRWASDGWRAWSPAGPVGQPADQAEVEHPLGPPAPLAGRDRGAELLVERVGG